MMSKYLIFRTDRVGDFLLSLILINSIKRNDPSSHITLVASKKNYELKLLLLMDYLSILILNYFLNPILAFTIYFCFLHSIRHSLSLIFQLNRSFNKGFKAFIKKAMPLTMVTAIIYLFSLLFLNNYLELNDAIYKVIFIGLASLTFPHILLEYLVEKNEK